MNRNTERDTIAGIATAPGGGIGVVRISGEKAVEIAAKVFRPQNNRSKYKSHRIYYGRVIDENKGANIDEALLLVMLAPKTYTREDVVEIQCHGGQESLRRVLGAVVKAGARIAEPGEFTKRSFMNGRIDLTQAEAVMDIINASSDRARRSASEHLEGRLSQKIDILYEKILDEIAAVETVLDSPENALGIRESECDTGAMKARIVLAANELSDLAETQIRGRYIKEGIKTVIAGKPNVGKSSLLNSLLGKERAIVTNVPGTTRDLLSEYTMLGESGIVLKLMDTAGIRDTEDEVEKIGVGITRKALSEADLIILAVDGSSCITDEDTAVFESVANLQTPVICVINKSDLPQRLDRTEIISMLKEDARVINISAKTQEGLEKLTAEIEGIFFGDSKTMQDGDVVVTSERHGSLLVKALDSIRNSINTIETGMPIDFITIDLMDACEYLGEITGRDAGENLIDNIFSKFCIGK